MATTVEFHQIYDRGEFGKCLEGVERELQQRPANDPERGELLALRAWCYYRRGEFGEAKKWAEEAGQVRFARECLAYVAAYAKGYKDDAVLSALLNELGDSVNAWNALVIRAREPDSTLTHEKVLEGVRRFENDTSVGAANFYHNAARFFYHKSRNNEDLFLALSLFSSALNRYGHDKNWHHRGAVHFWRSKILEQLSNGPMALKDDKLDTLRAAQQSLECWTEQVILDPSPRQKEQWENAVKRIRDLLS